LLTGFRLRGEEGDATPLGFWGRRGADSGGGAVAAETDARRMPRVPKGGDGEDGEFSWGVGERSGRDVRAP
jgi:hypothetical protein